MNSVAIVTLNGYFNYGNRLQNYALQETLKFLGFNTETIINEIKLDSKITIIKRLNVLTQYPLPEAYNKIKLKFWEKTNQQEVLKSKNMRTKIFKDFTNDYIKETYYTISEKNILKDLESSYDFFITGSDQVWNPNYINNSSVYFATFTEEHKRLSYAASFGISDIPVEHKANYKEWISGMHKLSVREDDGAKIIKELTGREAPVHVDPTLLLTKEKWLSISKEARNKPKGKYLLTYFLGGVPKEYKKQIDKIIKEKNLEVINLGDIKETDTYRTGPSEFIDYISDCSIFCTDSFHGAIFSIIFEKPFIVYERMGSSMSMYSRMETLLDKFKLEDRTFENIKSTEDAFDIDYSHVPSILEGERKKSFDYLKDALNIENKQ